MEGNYTIKLFFIPTDAGGSIHFIKKLVELMTPEKLELINLDDYIAFHKIAGVGNVMIFKLLFKKNLDLPNMWSQFGQLPLHHAAMLGQKHMVSTYSKSPRKDIEKRPFEDNSGSMLMGKLITSGLFDVALLMLRRHPNLAVSNPSSLDKIAQKPETFPSGARLNF